MELAVVDSNPAIVEVFENIGIALAKTDVFIIVTFAGMDGLRRNNVIAGHHDRDCNAGRSHLIGIEIVERACFVESVIKRPAQCERRVLVLQQRKFAEAPDRLAFLADRILEDSQPRGRIADDVVTLVGKANHQRRLSVLNCNHRIVGEQKPGTGSGKPGKDHPGHQ